MKVQRQCSLAHYSHRFRAESVCSAEVSGRAFWVFKKRDVEGSSSHARLQTKRLSSCARVRRKPGNKQTIPDLTLGLE